MRIKIRRALLSVSDKTGLEELARRVARAGRRAGLVEQHRGRDRGAPDVPVTPVADVTGFPEMLDHRVVTLHPRVHGGLLADLGNPEHVAELERHGIAPFELVVSNLYPFRERPGIETIDIGGPAMTRAAAKNHEWVTIVTAIDQYEPLIAELRANDGTVGPETRRAFAIEAFARTAAYDAAIVEWLQGDDEPLPRHLVLALERTDEQLRYGENPHQQAARYRRVATTSWWDGVVQHSGVALSYLNFYDTDAAWKIVHDLGSRPDVRDHQARQPVRRRGRRRSRHRVPPRARVRRAVGVRRDRRAESTARRRDRRARWSRGRRPTWSSRPATHRARSTR